MKFEDYKDGSWVAEIPAIAGCYALMDTREAALAELSNVFALIAEEYREMGISLPSDLKDLYLAERLLDRIRSDEEPTIPLEDVVKRYDVKS